MGNRRVRITVVIVAFAVLGFAGNQIRLANRALAEEQGGARDVTDRGWAVTLALAELRSAQQAYVADGQDREYWTDQADARLETVLQDVENLKQAADAGDLGGIDEAIADIRALDENARELLGSDLPLQASDEVINQGRDLFTDAAAQVQAAAQAERASRDEAMAAARSTRSRMMWLAAVVVGLAMLVLAPLNRSSEEDAEEYEVQEATDLSLVSLDNARTPDGVDLSEAAGGEAKAGAATAPPAAGGAAAEEKVRAVPVEPAAPDIAATAALCTDFGNLTDRAQIPGLLKRTAELMNARGLIVWAHDESAAALRPAMGHGYAAGTLARFGSIPLTEDNPTAAAFTARRIQIVRADDSDAGALAAPLMAAERCIGVLSAELRSGWESSDAVQATASIVAAQLAPLLPAGTAAEPLSAAAGTRDSEGAEPPPAAGTHDSEGTEPPAAATGTHDREGAKPPPSSPGA